MDALSDVLTGVDVRGSVFCYGEVRAPWCFEGGSTDSAQFHAVVEGEAWLRQGRTERRLESGDVLLLPRGGLHRLGSRGRKRAIPLRRAIDHVPDAPFARLAIGGDGQRTYLICGVFVVPDLDWHPLLRDLPDLVVVQAGLERWLPMTLTALHNQLEHAQLGASSIAGRLAEVLFIQVIAAWVRSQGTTSALADPHIGRAIGLIHREPGHPWTADTLARAIGMSRSLFFNRFREVVRDTPAAYLRAWRMTLAAKALRDEDVTLRELADRLGYGSESSFSRAFVDHHGVTPGAFRRALVAV